MKDRFFRMRRLLSGAFALLLIGGLMYSCSDDYDLPDKTPGWLGSSIYNYLKEQGNYTNTVKLIDDLKLDTVMARTGSKTLFVADDDAYNRFFANNTWGVRQYSDLSQSQKKLLLNSSMLDNAYLLEMMPNLTSGSMNSDGTYLARNRCLRQPTSLAATDSITCFTRNSADTTAIPKTYNLGLKNSGGKPDEDYWKRFHNRDTTYLAMDGTVPLMMHWIAGQMGEQKITDEDFAVIVGKSRQPNDAYIFGSKVIQQDITCQNGYIDKLDEVYTTPSNMAEMIRTNDRTKLYSHLLDRFSAPFFNRSLTTAYRALNPNVDSVFEKRYFSARSQGASKLDRDPKGNAVKHWLNYDPGWNTYYNASSGVQVDMAAMFAPSDAAMKRYFIGGGGQFLMDAYAVLPNTEENLMYNLDQIPLEVIQALINNLMKPSFIESVPSKYLTIMNDARDPMFSNAATVDDYKAKIDTCLIGNNGVVYVLNDVYTPARYASVSAPALVCDTLHIFNWAITADDKFIGDPDNAPLKAFISTYLLAMSTNFSFFIPSDRAMLNYYDPVSMAHTQPRVLAFTYNARNVNNPVSARAKKFDPLTGEVDSLYMTTTIPNTTVYNALKDMLEGHIIVDSTAAKLGVYDGNEYYVTKGGAPILVQNAELGKNGMTVQGGWQVDYKNSTVEATNNCHVTEVFDKSEKTNGYGNGMTYIIDHPIESTTKSVYSRLYADGAEDSPYYEFFNLTQVDLDVLEEAGFADAYSRPAERLKELNKYLIFTGNNPCLDQNVRFFNTYRYTVYVPTNESVRAAIDQGLPTWDTIAVYIQACKDAIAAKEAVDENYDSEADVLAYKEKAKAMITCLLNFVKYHFQDNSIFADNNPIEKTAYETACINNETNRYFTVEVESDGNHTLRVSDNAGHTRSIITEGGMEGNYNMLTRDIELNKTGENAQYIETSSFAVVHRIDGVLNFKALTNGRYDSDWATTSDARKFIAKYRIRN